MKEKAIKFEKLGKSRTYFIFNEDEDEFKILAYYTLAIQVLKVPEELLTGHNTKNLDGFGSKIRGEKITEFPVILIGQIGKNDLYRELISGAELVEYCLSTVFKGQKSLGGRIIMLECKDIPYLIKLYEVYGFRRLKEECNEGELLEMIRVLKDDEIIEPANDNH